MKRLLFLLMAATLLTACGSNEEPKVKEDGPVTEDQVKEETQAMTSEEATELIEYAGMGEDDKLVSLSIEGGEIKAVIEMAPHELLPIKDLAVTGYSQASDALLEHESWETLTIEYVGVGTISMERTEKETNEFDMYYFPTKVIEEQLK